MLMKTIKHVDDKWKPDEVEMLTQFKIGDRFNLKYDWCEKTSSIVGKYKKWHQDVAEVRVVDIRCNILVYPNEVMIFMKTEDPYFIERCRCNEVDAPEEKVLERIVLPTDTDEYKESAMTHTEVVSYVVEKVKTSREFYVNIIDVSKKSRLHVRTRCLDVKWYDVTVEIYDGTEYAPEFSYSANSFEDLAVIVRKSGWWLWDKYGYCKRFPVLMSGHEPCCIAIEKAVLDKPIEYEPFTSYFDRKILEDVRDKYGVDLYKECFNAVCEKYGFNSETYK